MDRERFDKLIKERRFRVVYIDEHDIHKPPMDPSHFKQKCLAAMPSDIPQNVVFGRIWHDAERVVYGCAVYHETFDAVPLGVAARAHNAPLEVLVIERPKVAEPAESR